MPIPTVSDFRTHFPEFASKPVDSTIQSHLDNAAEEITADVWDDLYDQGILYLTAHTLSLLPGSRDMRLSKESTETIYYIEYKRLMQTAVGGPWVAGDVTGVTAT